jgi:hypothetical protein
VPAPIPEFSPSLKKRVSLLLESIIAPAGSRRKSKKPFSNRSFVTQLYLIQQV